MVKKIIITGKPGVGKTTLITELIRELKKGNVALKGFWTKEIRENGRRVGFQFKTVHGDSGVLAHVNSTSSHRVSKYGVNVNEFEKKVLPLFEKKEDEDILVLDEIGKMEMLSNKFASYVSRLFQSKKSQQSILATLGIYYINLYKDWKAKNPSIRLFRLKRQNYEKIKQIIKNDLIN